MAARLPSSTCASTGNSAKGICFSPCRSPTAASSSACRRWCRTQPCAWCCAMPATAWRNAQRRAPRRSATATWRAGGRRRCLAGAPATRFMPASMCRARPSANSSSTQRHTPRLSAAGSRGHARAPRQNFVIVDGRPFAEYSKMNIPGGICCPNGELALRIHDIAPDPDTTIVVNCAGRTRSIIGAQMLIDFGVPNPVYALENGTQGWFLAGLAARTRRQSSWRSGRARTATSPNSVRAHALSAQTRRRIRHRGRGASLARRRPRARPTFSTCARPRSLPRRAVPGFAHCAGRPADPGDGPVGGRQRRAAAC